MIDEGNHLILIECDIDDTEDECNVNIVFDSSELLSSVIHCVVVSGHVSPSLPWSPLVPG